MNSVAFATMQASTLFGRKTIVSNHSIRLFLVVYGSREIIETCEHPHNFSKWIFCICSSFRSKTVATRFYYAILSANYQRIDYQGVFATRWAVRRFRFHGEDVNTWINNKNRYTWSYFIQHRHEIWKCATKSQIKIRQTDAAEHSERKRSRAQRLERSRRLTKQIMRMGTNDDLFNFVAGLRAIRRKKCVDMCLPSHR